MKSITVGLTLCLLFGLTIVHADIPIPENPGWRPVKDDVYLQESATLVETKQSLSSVAVYGGIAYVGTTEGIAEVRNDALLPTAGPTVATIRLRVIGATLWALTDDGLWSYDGTTWTHVSDVPVVDITEHGKKVIAVTATQIYRLEGSQLTPLLARESKDPILGVQSYSETIYVRHAKQLGFLKADRLEYYEVEDWNELPLGGETRDMQSLGNQVVVATSRGLGILRGASWHDVQGPQGLPYEDTTCVAPGFDHDYWVGTTRGAARFVDGAFQFFGAGRWLPNDKVNAIATGDNVVYLATDGGLSIIRYLPFTLQKKAAHYKQQLKDWGMLRLGMITLLNRNADGTYQRFFGDNDIGYTCHYLDALCFEYAVTKDPAVREEAVDIFKTIKWSEEITPIDGYPARSIHAVGEKGRRTDLGSAGRPAEWNRSGDGLWEWKGDTSSDEVVAHVYSVSLFHDLVAEGAEKKAAAEHLERLIGHIVDNGWVLMDLDGKPTVWAQWSPEFIFSPEHVDERGLNALQALSFAAVANRICPSPKFAAARQQLLDWNYLDNVLRQKRTFPHYTRFDDRLAFLAYYPVLRYETDPEVRAPLMRSLQRSWEIKRIEKQTWFDFIYGALTGNDCEPEQASDHLRAYPLDCFKYAYTNSHRSDLQNPTDYINYLENWKPLTPRDVGWQRWNRSFQQLDSDSSTAVLDPSGWLDAYWMGRYYGMIEAPTTEDPTLTTVEPRTDQPGAAPYIGPERPPIF